MKIHRKLVHTFGLAIGASVVMSTAVIADTRLENLFLSNYTPAETITVAFKGKPPYRNRLQISRKRKSENTNSSATRGIERTEIYALEITDEVETSSKKASTRRRHGHPYHSKRSY